MTEPVCQHCQKTLSEALRKGCQICSKKPKAFIPTKYTEIELGDRRGYFQEGIIYLIPHSIPAWLARELTSGGHGRVI